MNEHEKVMRDIEGLLESIRLDWQEIQFSTMSTEETSTIRKHVEWCITELKKLEEKLGQMIIINNRDLEASENECRNCGEML